MRKLLFTFFVCLAGTMFAQTASSTLQSQFDGLRSEVLTLREPAYGESLEYSATGELLKGQKGIRGADDLIVIHSMKLNPDNIAIEGSRAVLVWRKQDKKKTEGNTAAVGLRKKVSLKIQLGAAQRHEDVLKSLFAVFLQGEQAQRRPCPSDEELWNNLAQRSGGLANAADFKKYPLNCLPTGAKGVRIASGVEGPEMLGDPIPPPEFPSDSRRRSNDRCAFTLRVDESGKISDVIVNFAQNTPLPEATIEAMHKWRFKPALLKREHTTVPAIVDFEINFHLY